jgi:hypothetical protein
LGPQGSAETKESGRNPVISVPPDIHAKVGMLASALHLKLPETIDWMLNLDHPLLEEVRRSYEKTQKIQKGDRP